MEEHVDGKIGGLHEHPDTPLNLKKIEEFLCRNNVA